MSSPHCMKGHETVIGVRYSNGLMTLLSPSTWKASTTLLA